MMYELDEEFNRRVKHNFKLSVLLTSKSVNWKEDVILDSIYQLNGYRSHKAVKYEMNTSHIHVKFDEENSAREAIDFLNNLSSDLTAVLVDDMLRDWFKYEMKSGYNPPWTLTVVDIIGSPPLSLNFLTENILKSILGDFGDPYLLPYTAALNEPHVQILFGSMTEALAACMAFGEWCDKGRKVDSFFYRVRINPSDKEAMLIRKSGGTPKEAFKLDYFVNLRNEVYRKQNTNKPEVTPKEPRVKNFQNKAIQKSRKQKLASFPNLETKQNSSLNVGSRTPILCVPVIAPLNSYAEALRSKSKRINVNFTNAVLNIQQTCAVSTQSIDNSDSDNVLQSIQARNSEEISTCKDAVSLERHTLTVNQSSDYVRLSAPEKPFISPTKRHCVMMKQKNDHKSNTRMFERRK